MCNGREVERPHSPEFLQANAIYKRLLEKGMKPYRAEVNLYHEKLQLAGQPDLLMTDPEGNIVIVDWKRAKEIRYDNDRRHLKYPLEHLPESNYWLYSLQLNVYRHMLEDAYDMSVSSMMLAVVHPDAEQGRIITCPRLQVEIEAIVEYEQDCGAITQQH